MPNYYSPGVYIEEVNKGPRPIEAVATSVPAFVGFAPYSTPKDANRPVLVTSWTQFVQRFGKRDPLTGRRDPYEADTYLPHAVYGFFQNGGTRCYVVRVIQPDLLTSLKPNPVTVPTAAQRALKQDKDPEKHQLSIASKVSPLQDEIEVTFERAAGTESKENLLTLRVQMGSTREEFKRVTLRPEQPTPPDPPQADPNAANQNKQRRGAPGAANGAGGGDPQDSMKPITLENLNSKLITITRVNGALIGEAPSFGTYVIEVPQPPGTAVATVPQQQIIGEVTDRSGVAGLELADDVTMVCCPDLLSPRVYKGEASLITLQAVQQAMIVHCELTGGRMAILDAPRDFEPQRIEQWVVNEARYDSMFAALYYPWITVANPRAGIDNEPPTIDVPPSGHIAGIYARNDTQRGVHKAPANEIVQGALQPVIEISRGEQDGLNPNGINCIRAFPGRGIRVWGARTLSSDPAWRYVNVRRLFNMVEKSIERDTQWVVFEPNDPGLWSRVRRDVSAFLMTLWRDGMLFGNTPQEAFFVKCDEELNPPESRDLGRLVIEVGMAPVKPAEFVIFRFSQYAGGGA